MILKRLQVKTGLANLYTNTYIICDENTKETMVIDPGGESEKIIELLDILGANLKYIYLTHCHADHIKCVNEVKKAKGGKVVISRTDSEGINVESINMQEEVNVNVETIEVDSRVDDNDLIHIGDIEFKVILTPGHTKGSSSLYCEKERMIFTGDTLFSGTWGRTDLPTGDFEEIINSITNKIMVLPDETIVYPGHGKITMINDEKKIYLELRNKDF